MPLKGWVTFSKTIVLGYPFVQISRILLYERFQGTTATTELKDNDDFFPGWFSHPGLSSILTSVPWTGVKGNNTVMIIIIIIVVVVVVACLHSKIALFSTETHFEDHLIWQAVRNNRYLSFCRYFSPNWWVILVPNGSNYIGGGFRRVLKCSSSFSQLFVHVLNRDVIYYFITTTRHGVCQNPIIVGK